MRKRIKMRNTGLTVLDPGLNICQTAKEMLFYKLCYSVWKMALLNLVQLKRLQKNLLRDSPFWESGLVQRARLQKVRKICVLQVKRNSGRRASKWTSAGIESIKDIPLNKLGTIQLTASALKFPKSTLFWILQNGEIKAHSSDARPFLTPENIVRWIEFCKEHINDSKSHFDEMLDWWRFWEFQVPLVVSPIDAG